MPHRKRNGVQLGRFFLDAVVGRGGVGRVYRAIDTTVVNSPIYAIKCVQQSPRRLRRLIAEAENHEWVAYCPHVMMLFDVFEAEGCCFFVLPLCEMDLFSAIWRDNLFWRNDAFIKEVYIQILDGVIACHNKGIYHRDLKPANIMCNAGCRNIQIGDFGLSSSRRVCRDGGCGTRRYMSPECLNKATPYYYGDAADIWSLGVILFNMVTSASPWHEASPKDPGYMGFTTSEDHLLRLAPISVQLNALLDHMWHPVPQKRLSLQAIRKVIVAIDSFYRPYEPHNKTSRPCPAEGRLHSRET